MSENELARIIVDAAVKVHRYLGPGLLEKTYQECMFYELLSRGLRVEKEKYIPIVYYERPEPFYRGFSYCRTARI